MQACSGSISSSSRGVVGGKTSASTAITSTMMNGFLFGLKNKGSLPSLYH